MNTSQILTTLLFVVSFSVLQWNCTSSTNEKQNEGVQSERMKKTYFTCPMHPSVQRDKPGACPVCNMSLVEVTDEEEERSSHEEQKSPGEISLSPSRQVLANVSTTVAEKMKLTKEIRAVGKIDYAEPNYAHISMRFPGRLEKKYINYTGQKVRVGDPVVDIYSPEAISAQKEFLLALNSNEDVQRSGIDLSDAQTLLQQTKQKLLRWGFAEEEISELQKTKQVKDIFTMYSPVKGTVIKNELHVQHYAAMGEDLYDVVDLSTVWMQADIYEKEILFIKIGEEVDAISEAYPSEHFFGKVTFISPTIDASARTVQVRIEFPNKEEKLKTELFMNATIKIDLPEKVVVPQSAIISTGRRTVVWIQKSEKVFEPRIVTLGTKVENYVQILSGIEEGETVVTSGGYLLDSESQLEMGMGTSEHAQHGGMKMETNSNKEKNQQHQH